MNLEVTRFKIHHSNAGKIGTRILTQPDTMKSYLPVILLLNLSIWGFQGYSQTSVRKLACSDLSMIHQADSIKEAFSTQGYIVVKEASMNMQSENEIPVIVPLSEGGEYRFVFIGDMSSRTYEVSMYDWDEKKVAYQKKDSSDEDRNVISYSYVPKLSEFHMIKPVQVNKDKKNLCGYVMLLKKVKA